MNTTAPPVVKRSLGSWIRTSRFKLQIVLLVLIAVTVFARVLPLEMQKRIINEAINLRKMDLLLLYCGIYLLAVISASGLKYLINILQTLISERALADMRKALYRHILALPMDFFRKTQPGMVVASLVTELAVPANYVGMSLSVPIINFLTLLAFAAYLLWLNPLLALVSLSIYPLVIFLVPLLQKRVNRANKKRVDGTRNLSSLIGEAITGIHEIQANGAHGIESKKGNAVIEGLNKIRIRWNLFKNGIKVFNNFVVGLGPFLVFILGGYLTIQGELELGALVAFLSAQEKLYDPWKELIEFYQVYQDGRVNYRRTMEYFDVPIEHTLVPQGREPYALEGRVEVSNMSFVTKDSIRLLDNVNLTLDPGEHLALVGFSGSGKSTLALCIGQLYRYSRGRIELGGQEVAELSKRDLVENMGFVSQTPFIFNGSIEDNLLYACRARMDGNPPAAPERLPDLDDIIEVLQQTGIFVDVLRFGMNTVLDSEQEEQLVELLVRVRHNLQRDFGAALADYVEFYDENKYLYFSNVAENLIFGSTRRPEFAEGQLHRNDYFLSFLEKANLTMPLLTMGATLAGELVDILGNLTPDKMFFEQSPLEPEELEVYKILVKQLEETKLHQLEPADRQRLLDLGLRFIPGKHKVASLPQMLETLILEGRHRFREMIIADDPEAFSFYQLSDYIPSQSILNNIFFGKVTSATSRAQEKINQSIVQLLIEEDLLETIVKIGMQFQVGSKGDRLSGGQRQKLAIARAFLKNPRILIMDEATSALDNKSQARIQRLLNTRWKGSSTLIAVVHRLDIIQSFDKVAVMKAGKIAEMGTYEELIAKKGLLNELVGQR